MELLALLVLLALGCLWYDSLSVREVAVQAAREACANEALLFLDDTVGIVSVKLARNSDGHVQLQRAYDFEFSDTGDNRVQGGVVLLGRRVVMLNVGVRPPPIWRSLQ